MAGCSAKRFSPHLCLTSIALRSTRLDAEPRASKQCGQVTMVVRMDTPAESIRLGIACVVVIAGSSG